MVRWLENVTRDPKDFIGINCFEAQLAAARKVRAIAPHESNGILTGETAPIGIKTRNSVIRQLGGGVVMSDYCNRTYSQSDLHPPSFTLYYFSA